MERPTTSSAALTITTSAVVLPALAGQEQQASPDAKPETRHKRNRLSV